MYILGIESSCDECSAAIVENGKKIVSHIIATQVEDHKLFYGIVPEIASRLHSEWIYNVVQETLSASKLTLNDIDAIAVTTEPGLMGSLIVGLSFAKGLAYSLQKPLIPVNHIKAHLYAPQLEFDVAYPYIGLLLSGGHSLICIVRDSDDIEVLGTTIDDACGEAFDKVAKFYDLGYPGGVYIDKMAQDGDAKAYHFPKPKLKHRGEFDVSYSGLKTAVIHQSHQFWNQKSEQNMANLAASFQRTAIDILLDKALLACERYKINRLVAGGGVAANSYLRQRLNAQENIQVYYPSFDLCTDNAAMIAGLGYHNFLAEKLGTWQTNASSRSQGLHKAKPQNRP